MGGASLFLNDTPLTSLSGTALGDAYGADFLDRGSIPLVSTRENGQVSVWRSAFIYDWGYPEGYPFSVCVDRERPGSGSSVYWKKRYHYILTDIDV